MDKLKLSTPAQQKIVEKTIELTKDPYYKQWLTEHLKLMKKDFATQQGIAPRRSVINEKPHEVKK